MSTCNNQTYGVQTGVPQWVQTPNCQTCLVCPDFVIKRHDTRPSFKVSLEDCTGLPSDDFASDTLLAEVSMWGKGRLKTAITASDTYFALADNMGFDQIITGDIIIMDRVRRPEQMLVLGFDETNKLIQVSRGFNNTEACAWSKGTHMKIFRIKDAVASIERSYQDVTNTDGTTTNKMVGVYLTYDWQPNDTCVPGLFMLEFKLLQMLSSTPPHTDDDDEISVFAIGDVSLIPSFTPSTLSLVDYGCTLGAGVEWVRRYPQAIEGFSVQIVDSPTQE